MKHEHMISFRLAQMWALCKFATAYIVALFYKKKEIWLVSERGVDARDNGYCFFKYLRTQHPEIEAYYIIAETSADYHRLLPYKDHVVSYRSMAHYIMIWRANVLISTHIQGYFPFAGLGLWVKRNFLPYKNKKHVSIKHGITCNYIPFLDYKNTQLDFLVSASKWEYEAFVTQFHYPKEKVFLTGFCRYDNLNQSNLKNQILLMPTWREWLYKEGDILNSQYVQEYSSFLRNPMLHSLLEKNGLTLVFYPHHEIQPYLHIFEKETIPNVVIARQKDYDVQQLLKESRILITDYSSVFFDFAYMSKPVLFYQFDSDRFRKEHYQQGWYSYERGVGPVLLNQQALLESLRSTIENGCMMESGYSNYSKELFAFRDANNCARVYNAIRSIIK